MIKKNGKRIELDPVKVKFLREKFLSKNGRIDLQMSSALERVENIKNDKGVPISRRVKPPGVGLPTTVVLQEQGGAAEYRYYEQEFPQGPGKETVYLPASIEVSEGGKEIVDIDLIYFLYYFSPYLEGGDGSKIADEAGLNIQKKLVFYDLDAEAKSEMDAQAAEATARYKILSVWDQSTLLDIARRMYVPNATETTSKQMLQKIIIETIIAKAGPSKWEDFLQMADDDRAAEVAENVQNLVGAGVFVFDVTNYTWFLVADGDKSAIAKLSVTERMNPMRSLAEKLIKNPAILSSAQNEMSRILAGAVEQSSTKIKNEGPERYSADMSLETKGEKKPVKKEPKNVNEGKKLFEQAWATKTITRKGPFYVFRGENLAKSKNEIYAALNNDEKLVDEVKEDIAAAQ